MTINEYLIRQEILNTTLFRITQEGKGYFIYEGKEYTREQFRQKFPLPVSFVSYTKPNYDTTRNFLLTD